MAATPRPYWKGLRPHMVDEDDKSRGYGVSKGPSTT
jgi:hypothetical protein